MVQRVQIYVIVLTMQLKNFVKLMQVHKLFDWIYLQYLYQHHEKEVHEHNLPREKKIEFRFFISINYVTFNMVKSHIQTNPLVQSMN